MNSKDHIVLEKLEKHCRSIIGYCERCCNLQDFEADPMCVEATVFNLMQIGELAKSGFSDETKNNIPSIPWRQLYGMRNRIVHGYDGISMQIVWDTVSEDIPILCEELRRVLSNAAL